MPLKTHPKLSDTTLVKWIDDRADKLDAKYPDDPKHLRGEDFISMVGNDPRKPKVDVANLMRAFDLHTRATIYRWLNHLIRERES